MALFLFRYDNFLTTFQQGVYHSDSFIHNFGANTRPR
jgi:hypothetical protein